MYGRLAALPDQAEPLQRAQLLAALSVGTEIIHLRRLASAPWARPRSSTPRLTPCAQGNSTHRDRAAASTRPPARLRPDAGPETDRSRFGRAVSILAISEALAQHGAYFDAGAPA